MMIITVMSQMKYKKLSGKELEELVRGMNGWESKKLTIIQTGQMSIIPSQLN